MKELDKINGELNEIVENEIFGEHILPKQDLIQKARDFALRSLNGDIKKGSKEDYCMFLVSKFLLLKEMIIKKDSDEHILYFDYDKNKVYLPMIKTIVDCIKANANGINGIVKDDSTEVKVEPEELGTEEIKDYIWIFNKFRDSLEHNCYKFDLFYERIIINNVCFDEDAKKIKYALECKLPIELLELCVYLSGKEKEEDIKVGLEHIAITRNIFGYKNYKDGNDSIVSDYIKCVKDGSDSIIKDMNFLDKNNSYDNIDSVAINEYAKQQEEKLSILLKEIKSSNILSVEQLEFLYKNLELKGLVDTERKEIVPNFNPDRFYIKKIEIVINDISRILNLNKKSNKNGDEIRLASVYNYMHTIFSLNDFDFKSNEVKKKLMLLKISKLNPIFLKHGGGKFCKKVGTDVNSINDDTQTFNKFINKYLDVYYNVPDDGKSRVLNTIISAFCEYICSVLNSLTNINALVFTSIRNSVAHANVSDSGRKGPLSPYISGGSTMILYDQSNQSNDESINFICSGDVTDFFEVIGSLENSNPLENSKKSDDLNVSSEEQSIYFCRSGSIGDFLNDFFNEVSILCPDCLRNLNKLKAIAERLSQEFPKQFGDILKEKFKKKFPSMIVEECAKNKPLS